MSLCWDFYVFCMLSINRQNNHLKFEIKTKNRRKNSFKQKLPMSACTDLFEFYRSKVSFFFYLPCVIFYIFAAIAFSSELVTRDSKGNMYRYFTLKSMSDTVVFVLLIINNIYVNERFVALGNYGAFVANIALICYFIFIFFMLSMLFEVAAT